MNLITLPKNLKPFRITLFPDYISDGHWAIKKSVLKNAAFFTSVETTKAYFPKATVTQNESNIAIEQVNTNIGPSPDYFTATKYLESNDKRMYRFFVNAITGALTQFDCDYLKLFTLKGFPLDSQNGALWGSAKGACRDTHNAEDMTFLILPVRFEEQDLTVFQATVRALAEKSS